jgi:hypothetical protein
MADKNFARSGTGDAGLLADDDPLSELARLVNFDPRPVQGVTQSFSENAQPVPRRENAVLALEDELMRAFEQYDAPANRVSAQPLVEPAAERHVEPVFDVPAPLVEDRAAIIDEIPVRDTFVNTPRHQEPLFAEPTFETPVETYQAPVHVEPVVEPQADAFVSSPVEDFVAPDVYADEARDWESAFEETPTAVEAPAFLADVPADSALLLADELEGAVQDVPPVSVEAEAHAGLQFAERFEPHFEAPPQISTVSEPETYAAPEPTFLGLQPAEGDTISDLGVDLERELELSLGDTFTDGAHAQDASAEAAFVQPLPVAEMAIERAVEPVADSWMPADTGVEHAEPFHAETAYYAGDEPHFVSEMPIDTEEDHARALAEAQQSWQAEPVHEAAPDYRVQSVQKGQGYGHDSLLAEVELYPVPEAGSPFSASTAAAATTAAVTAAAAQRNSFANVAAIFGRATPTGRRETVAEKAVTSAVPTFTEPAFTAPAPIIETRQEPVSNPMATAEPDIDFDNLDFDLSDIDLDLSDFSLDETPAVTKPVARAEVAPVETARAVEAERPVRREPAVAVPVSTYTAPQPIVSETADGSLPFDPTMIADTDVGVAPVTELDVPQLPVVEKEKLQAYQPDFDFDLDAEMAQLFTEPAAPARAEDLSRGVAVGAATVGQPSAQINDVDDFERALEEDFRRSLHQPERMAIPVDPGQANTLYGGDGYDDEQTRPRRGMLIAASVAALLLVGGGGVYAWSSFTGGGTASSGEPRVILADKEPIKVVPEERGGKTVPNQDKAVYDRVAGDGANTPQQEQLVTSSEEPIDVVQRTLTPETLPFDDADDGQETAGADDGSRLLPGVDEPEKATADAGKPVVSPRKVRTMIVKPDGTLVAREDTPATQETAQLDAKATATTGRTAGEATTANAEVDPNASLRAEQAATGTQPRSALADVANAQVDDTAPVRTVKTTTFGADAATTAGNNTPTPESRPVDQPVNVVGTVTENGNVRGQQTAAATSQAVETTQVAAVTPGSYVIQIASLPSEAEAQKTYNSLSAKFGSVIGGRGVDIKQVAIPNKGTFYRVRIPAGSREEANSLCNRYKGAGGSCLVTR